MYMFQTYKIYSAVPVTLQLNFALKYNNSNTSKAYYF